MQKRLLGKGGPEVGAVGLGCWSFAGSYGPTDEAESHATLAKALDLGVDFLDTSNVYGMGVSEKVIGSFIKNNGNKFVIASKVGIRRNPDTGEREFCNTEDHIRQEIEDTLQRLNVERIDLYYIHRRQASIPIEDVTGFLARLVDEGKIGGIGFSEIAPSSLRRANAVHPVMAVQNEYSLWTRTPDQGLIQTCNELGTAFVPFSPLCRGMLGAILPDPATFPESDFRYESPRFVEPNFTENCRYFGAFQGLAKEFGTTSVTLGLAWILSRGAHLIPIPGTRSPAHLQECARAAEISLDQEILRQIDETMPVGFAHGERYKAVQWPGIEHYC